MAIRTRHTLPFYLACCSVVLGMSEYSMASQTTDPSSTQTAQETSSASSAERQIALDVVSALLQVENMGPGSNTLHMMPPQDTFGANLGHFFKMAGYKVSLNNDNTNPNFIDYFITDKSTEENTIKTYQVNVGQVKFRRDYLISANSAQPQSTMYLRGANASAIRLNDEIFDLNYTETYADEESTPAEDSQAPVQLLVETLDTKQNYASGDPIALSVSINYESRVYCYYKDGHGQIVKIYPNRFNTDNHFTPGQSVVIPSTDHWSINATRTGATDDFLCIATDPGNESLISALQTEPDLEPLAARSLAAIQERVSGEPNAPVITTDLILTVH